MTQQQQETKSLRAELFEVKAKYHWLSVSSAAERAILDAQILDLEVRLESWIGRGY